MTDIDSLYASIDAANSKLVNKGLVSSAQEDTRSMKYLTYNASISSGAITITPPSVVASSQFQEVILQLKLDSTFDSTLYDGHTVLLYISGPNDDDPGNYTAAVSTDTYENTFAYEYHMVPVVGTANLYEIHLNEVLGYNLNIGTSNKCKFVFKCIAHNTSTGTYTNIHQTLLTDNAPLSLELYKTSLNYSYQPDDLTRAFNACNDMLTKLEA